MVPQTKEFSRVSFLVSLVVSLLSLLVLESLMSFSIASLEKTGCPSVVVQFLWSKLKKD